MLLTILLVLLFLAVLGGGWGYSRGAGPAAISPVGLILVILVILYFTGNL